MQKLGIHYRNDDPRIRYTLDFLRLHPLIEGMDLRIYTNNDPKENDLNIYYGNEEKDTGFDFLIPAQQCFFRTAPTQRNYFANEYDYEGKSLYSVEVKTHAHALPLIVDHHFQFDLLETIFFHISRYEEVFATPDANDESGWLREDRHFLVINQLEKQAVVDQLVAGFLGAVTRRSVTVPTTYDLSHDIDFLFRYPTPLAFLRAVGGSVYRRSGFSAVNRHWESYRSIVQKQGKDPYDCFDWLLSRDSAWTQKTVYLMAGGETSYDNHYQLEHPKIRSLIEAAEGLGYDIGLHPSYNAGLKPTLFQKEKEGLERVRSRAIIRSRQHWLRFNWQETPDILSLAEIEEDASMGYRHRLGFRCGTGFPYRLYDFKTACPFPWQERPLAFMESAALHEAQNKKQDLVVLMSEFLQQNHHHTHLSINFHNSNFDPSLPHGQQLADFYRAGILPLGSHEERTTRA